MLKVKDWPPRSAFTQEMQRHFVVSDWGGTAFPVLLQTVPAGSAWP
jgi:hypothetical protein